MNLTTAERKVAEVCETVSAHLSSTERPLLHLYDLLITTAEQGGRLEGERLGYALADAEAALVRLEEAAEYTRSERGNVSRLKIAK